MEIIAPLVQTILWVFVISLVLICFYRPLYGILVVLKKRIEAGSNIKAGPFELFDQMKIQDPEQQIRNASLEIQEVIQDDENAIQELQVNNFNNNPKNQREKLEIIQARYFQAEDLVLRSIQNEFNIPVTRQLSAGKDLLFDGAFVNQGRLSIIEVKYAKHGKSIYRYNSTISKLVQSITNVGWKNVQIIFAVVFENIEDLKNSYEDLSNITADQDIPIILRTYSLKELQRKFNMID